MLDSAKDMESPPPDPDIDNNSAQSTLNKNTRNISELKKMTDCLLCGGIHQSCSQMVLSTFSLDPGPGPSGSTKEGMTGATATGVSANENHSEEKWSSIFCKLFDMDKDENVEEIENILQGAFYCDVCCESLRSGCEMYIEIQKLKDKLDRTKILYKTNLEAATTRCSSRSSKVLHSSKETEESQHLKREQILQTLHKHHLPLLLKVEPPDVDNVSNSSTCDNDIHSDFENSTSNNALLYYPQVKVDESTENFHSAAPPDEENTVYTTNRTQEDENDNPSISIKGPQFTRSLKSRPRKTSKNEPVKNTKLKPTTKGNPSGSGSSQVASRASKNIYRKYYKTKPKTVPFGLRKRKSNTLPDVCNSSSSESETESESDDDDNDDIKDPEFRIQAEENRRSPSTKRRNPLSLPVNRKSPRKLSTSGSGPSEKFDHMELRKKYNGLIKKYDVKEVVISVDKLADADFDAAAVGGDGNYEKGKRHCPILGCNMGFIKKHRLGDHLKTVHRGIKYPYQCSVCHKKFTQRRQFTDHENIHTKLTPHICPFPNCGKKFSTLGRLFGHKGNHHKEARYQCEVCSKCFIIKGSYDYHIRSHLGERPFVCEVCGLTFIRTMDLKNHQRFHPELNMEQLKCKFCGKIFSSPNSLKVHEKFHSGDCPFQCAHCDYRAPTNYVLNKHKLIHRVGKDYECNLCGGKFKHGNSLAKHKKYVCEISKDCKDFVCTFCGRGYKSKIHLAKHEKLHTDTSKPFLCSMCGKGFRHKDKLQRHILQVHTDKDGAGTTSKTRNTGPRVLPSNLGVIPPTSTGTANSSPLIASSSATFSKVDRDSAREMGHQNTQNQEPPPASDFQFQPLEFVQNY